MRDPEATRTMFEGLKNRWTFLNDEQRDTLVLLADMLEKLGPTALRVILMQTERLVVGRETYNDDFEKDRDWLIESLQECLDNQTYLTVKILKLLEKERGGDKVSGTSS